MKACLSIVGSNDTKESVVKQFIEYFSEQNSAWVCVRRASNSQAGSLEIVGKNWRTILDNFGFPLSQSGFTSLLSYLPPFVDIVLLIDITLDSHVPILHVGSGPDDSFDINEENIIARIADHGDKEEIRKIAERFLSVSNVPEYFTMYVNGQKIGCKEFVRDFVTGTINGMITPLKKVNKPQSVYIHYFHGDQDA